MSFLTSRDKTALSFGDTVVSFKQLTGYIAGFAEIIRKRMDCSQKDEFPPRIIIIAENRPEWVYALYGTWRSGCVAIPVDFMSSADEISYIMKNSEASAIVCSDKTRKAVELAVKNSGIVPVLISLDAVKIPELPSADIEKFEPEKVALVIYTSGTTGSPKGVMLTFANIYAITDVIIEPDPLSRNLVYREDDVVIAILPFHHIYPIVASLVGPLCAKSHVALIREFSADEILGVCSRHGATRIIGVPRLYTLLHKGIMAQINKRLVARILFKTAKAINSQKFSRIVFGAVQKKFGGKVRSIFVGGSKMDISVSRDFEALGFAVMEGYGMTETAPCMSMCNEYSFKLGTVGFVMPGGEIKVIGGELCYKGPNVMKGYFRNPKATAESFDKEGFFHTGDKAEIDRDGYITITGRIKEIIVLPNGKNINPEEIENDLLGSFPLIKDAGIIENDGKLFAIIYPDFQKIRDDNIVNIRETLKWEAIDRYNQKASHHKKIMDFAVVETELPRTRIGKLRRFALKDMIGSQKDSRLVIEEPDFEEYEILKRIIEEMSGRKVHAGDHLELDLNMDSLDRVELQGKVEASFGFALSNDDISHFSRIVDLASHIRERKTSAVHEASDWGTLLRQKISFRIPKKTYMMRMLLLLLKPIFWFYLRIKVTGLEKIPLNSAVIFAPNHQSVLDGLVLSAIFKRRIRKRTYFFAKDRNFNSRFKRFFADRANVILLNINKNLKETLQQMAAIADAGNNVVVFPEGARSRDGKIMKFKKTFAIVSKELSVPIVPVTIDGTFNLFSMGSFIPKPGKIKIRFHDPIKPGKKTYEEIVEKTYSIVKSCLVKNESSNSK
jgi:long-chain acyl-CoA synthetase